MKAIILGCSHAAGAEMEKDPTRSGLDLHFGWTHSFPVLIAQALGYQPCNYAIAGGSNDAMFRIFVEQIDQLTCNDIIIACWTGANRTEVRHELDEIWLPFCQGIQKFTPLQSSEYALSGQPAGGEISASQDYESYLTMWEKFGCDNQSGVLNKIKNIQSLNHLAQRHDVQVVNIDSFYPVQHVSNIDWAWPDTFFDWAVANNEPRTDWGHFFLSTHQKFADLVVQKLSTYL